MGVEFVVSFLGQLLHHGHATQHSTAIQTQEVQRISGVLADKDHEGERRE